MEIITILKLKIESNHTIEWHRYYWCTYHYSLVFGLNSSGFIVYLCVIYCSELAVTNFRKTLSFYSVRLFD